MTESPTIDAVKLSRAMDQSLAAKVLKVANSAFYGRRNVNSIHKAIVVIGFDAVKEIILTSSLFHTFHDSQDIEALQPLWQHSLECALIAKRLAWIFRYESSDEAYFAGLIHDIGKLIIQQHFPDQYQKIENYKAKGVENLIAEQELLGITHAIIGAKMAEYWSFPETVVDAISHHHDKNWKQNPRLGRILHNADRFILGLVSFPLLLKDFQKAGMSYPSDWEPSDIQSVADILEEEMKKAETMLTLSLGG